MSSYQNIEDGQVSTRREESGRTKQNWASIVILCAVGIATTVFAFSAASSSQVASTFAVSNVQKGRMTYTPMYTNLEDADYKALFSDFKMKFKREYADVNEESDRFDNFKLFLANVDVLNAREVQNGGSAIHGITKFSDMLQSEFASLYLGYKEPKSAKMPKKVSVTPEMRERAAAATTDDGVINWYMTYTTAVKNQGYCGSCWAFSATEQIESDSIRLGLLTTSDTLSPEQVVNCAPESDDCYGCDGGWPLGAYEYVETTGGIESEANYPYDSYYGNDETCTANPSEYEVTVTSFSVLSTEDDMITYVTGTGPLSVCVDASTWSSYVSGIVTVCGDDLDHCVQVTGINTEEDYWIVRNSWGTDWGEAGFIYLETGKDMCEIAYVPSYTSTESV